MSTSLMHILTIAGKAAGEVVAMCDALRDRRVASEEPGYGSDDWSDADHDAIREFCDALIDASRQLPVTYYAQYLDAWSVGCSQFWLLNREEDVQPIVNGVGYNFAWYTSQRREALLADIMASRRCKFYRTQFEDRWYLDHVFEALENAAWLNVPFVVVTIDHAWDGSRLNEEIEAAMDKSMKLPKLGRKSRQRGR